jgi:hypothetical protein
MAGEFRRFPFFDEQKSDPNVSEGNILPVILLYDCVRTCRGLKT